MGAVLLLVAQALNLAGLAAAGALLFTPLRRRYYRGRLITRPLARRLRRPPHEIRRLISNVTFAAWLTTFGAVGLGDNDVLVSIPLYVLGVGVGLPWIDDVVTGDETDWRRRWQRLRNRVRWRMTLPAPAAPNPA